MALERRTQKEPCMGHDSPALTRACPMQILSVPSTETAKKAALITQRTAMINEGKANPIASTRKEYLDMKARHCRPAPAAPRRHQTPRSQSHGAPARSLSLSLSLIATSAPIPDVRRRPTAPPSLPSRRQ